MKWEVQQETIFDGWMNAVSDPKTGKPMKFDTKQEAEAKLAELMHDMRDAENLNDMQPFSVGNWRVKEVEP